MARFMLDTEHICGCGHRCVKLSPLGIRVSCAHFCPVKKAA